MTANTAFERAVGQGGPRLAAAETSRSAAQLDRWASFDGHDGRLANRGVE